LTPSTQLQKAGPGILVLALFLLWRGSNSVYVWLVDPQPIMEWHAGLTDSDDARIARALELPPTPSRHIERYRLLKEHVPPDSRVLVLHEYTGLLGSHEIRSYMRISSLLYPLYMRMITALPAPPPLPVARRKTTFLLDVRVAKGDGPGLGYTEVARTTDAVLWHKADGDR
jgi:hypothetical protein